MAAARAGRLLVIGALQELQSLAVKASQMKGTKQ